MAKLGTYHFDTDIDNSRQEFTNDTCNAVCGVAGILKIADLMLEIWYKQLNIDYKIEKNTELDWISMGEGMYERISSIDIPGIGVSVGHIQTIVCGPQELFTGQITVRDTVNS